MDFWKVLSGCRSPQECPGHGRVEGSSTEAAFQKAVLPSPPPSLAAPGFAGTTGRTTLGRARPSWAWLPDGCLPLCSGSSGPPERPVHLPAEAALGCVRAFPQILHRGCCPAGTETPQRKCPAPTSGSEGPWFLRGLYLRQVAPGSQARLSVLSRGRCLSAFSRLMCGSEGHSGAGQV